jgi:hypothetical protein
LISIAGTSVHYFDLLFASDFLLFCAVRLRVVRQLLSVFNWTIGGVQVRLKLWMVKVELGLGAVGLVLGLSAVSKRICIIRQDLNKKQINC